MNVAGWLLTIFAVGFATTYLLTGAAERLGQLLGTIDRPRPGEVQQRSVPRSGGYAMLIGLLTALTLSIALRPAEVAANPADDLKLLGAALGTLAIIPLAILDDRRRLGPGPQFLGQLVIATIPVIFGLRLGSLAPTLGTAIDLPGWLDVPLTLFWIVGMINAINLIDVMDGLAGGIASVAALVLCLRSFWFDQVSIAVLPLALLACLLAFLRWNFHPARVFMGSSGAILLGYWLAVSSTIGGAKVGTAFVLLGLPILDTAWVIVRRLAGGRSPFHGGDQEHLPHRLYGLGLSHLKTVLLLYAFTTVFGLLALGLHSPATGPTPGKLLLIAGMVGTVGLMLGLVTQLGVRRSKRRRSIPPEDDSAGS